MNDRRKQIIDLVVSCAIGISMGQFYSMEPKLAIITGFTGITALSLRLDT